LPLIWDFHNIVYNQSIYSNTSNKKTKFDSL
jgi:hypothetical protein